MDFIQSVFGKPLRDVSLQDLKIYFSRGRKETNINEFKAYIDQNNPSTTKARRDNEKITTIIQTLCAFLNSEGGFLIWGAPKGKSIEDEKEETYIGDLTPVELFIEQDQFINKVTSQISPWPRDILYQRIDDGSNHYYVFQVFKSEYSPHQFKGTYYMRLDGQTVAAPHYFVEALMKKVKFPILVGFMKFGEIKVFRHTIGLPVILTIHNLTRYIHEKNLEYRIIVGNGDLFRADVQEIPTLLFRQSKVEKICKSVFHYNAPCFDEYLLVNSRISPYSPPIKIVILFSFWGELSPVKICTYNITISLSDNNNYRYEIEANENEYSYDRSDTMEMTEQERINKVQEEILNGFKGRFPEMKIYELLNEMR